MSTTKRILGDYNVKTLDSNGNIAGNIVMSAETIRIIGDMTVSGNMTTVSSTNLEVSDNIIVVNYGETGAGVTLDEAGFMVDRGSLPNVAMVWDESQLQWLFSDYTGQLKPLVTSLDGDLNPSLGGNLNTNNYQIQSIASSDLVLNAIGTGNVVLTANAGAIEFDTYIRLVKQSSDPTALANNNYFYHKTVAGGGSGLYFTNTESSPNTDELVSKQRALVYSLIL